MGGSEAPRAGDGVVVDTWDGERTKIDAFASIATAMTARASVVGPDRPAATLRISMFGPLRIERVRDGDLVDVIGPGDLGGVKTKELLELLLLARGHPVRKDVLIDALWRGARGEEPRNPTATLESYVSVLRKHLFDDRDEARRTLVTMTGAYRFAIEHVALDLVDFDDAMATSDRPRHVRLPHLLRAAALANGDLLEDVQEAVWLEQERELARDRVARLHLLIAADLLVQGDPAGAARHGERVLMSRPYSEEAYQMIMLAEHALGHSDASRRAFERCRRLLAEELGFDCTSETEDLGAAIDAGVPAATLVAARWPGAPTHRAPARRRADRRDPSRTMPFVGRRDELTRARVLCEQAAKGSFQMVAVRGRAGMGRSAFLSQLEPMLVGPEGLRVGRAEYTPVDLDRPGVPLASAIVRALAGTSGADAARAYAAAPFVDTSDATLHALRRLVVDHGPLTLLLDDLQWADADTITALEWLGRNHPDLPLAVVATVRASVHDSVASSLAQTVPVASDVIELAPLQAGPAVELRGIDAALIRATGGVPSLLADAWRWIHAGGGSGPSPSLRDAVLRHVRGLGNPYAALLRAAATLPEPFTAEQLATAAMVPMGLVDRSTVELCRVDLFERHGRGIRFRATLVREVLSDALPSRSA
jgi:SARP family transcriptional regulator, regulator of embCAB operon